MQLVSHRGKQQRFAYNTKHPHWRALCSQLVLIGTCMFTVVGCASDRSESAGMDATHGASPIMTLNQGSTLATAVPTAESQADVTVGTAATTMLPAQPPTRYTYEVVATFPHDAHAFTQGLLFDGETLYEGTGLYGESTLRRVDLMTGVIEQQFALPAEYFGEGIALIDDRIFQLTWREQTGFIYDKVTFEKIGEFSYQTEGWGFTYDGSNLILSDGSDQLFTVDPTSLQVTDQVTVTYFDAAEQQRKPVVRLNELEYVNGTVLANIWQTNYIVRIEPQSGNVTGIIDLTGLLPEEERTATTDVLNGIAYRPTTDQLYVTGKKWPKLFEIRLIEQQ